MESIVEVKELYKSFRYNTLDVEVLKGINLNIKSGEFVSIMGPSGSGKSTLLYLIGGLDRPSSGSIFINGKDISTVKDVESSIMRRREMGFIFQFYNLIPNLNIEDNILLPILLDGKNIKNYRGKLDKILDEVGIANRRYHTPKELSGGQQQRVAIARALIGEPDLILADEPTGSLDTNTGFEILKLLKRINKEKKKTIIMVTHSNEAAEYSDRIVYVRDGKVC